MRKPKSYSVLEVFNFSDVGLVYEFYSSKQSNFIADEIGRLTGKQIVLTGDDRYTPSYANAILLKEYDAKRARYQLKFAQQNYHSVTPILESVTKWINENCETSYDTQLKVSLSFDHGHLDTLSRISGMNPTRMILKFDESEVYKRFPEQANSPYALSIKNLAPITTYINESEFENNINYILSTPHAEYYGINFTNHTQGILGCNYIGGPEYASKHIEIQQIIEYFIIKAYQSLNEEEYTPFEVYELKKLTEGLDKLQMSYFDPDVFLKEFTDLKVFVDLKSSPQILKTFWSHIRKPLFEMIVNGGLRSGQFNFDADLGRMQLRKGKLRGVSLSNVDFFGCDLSGVFENCDFSKCDVKKSRIYDSMFERASTVNESYLERVSMNAGNKLHKSFVVNNEEILNCEATESVVKYATISPRFTADEKTTVIVKEEQLPKLSAALEVDEIRDYSWIKKMNPDSSKIKGFANEYNKDKYRKIM